MYSSSVSQTAILRVRSRLRDVRLMAMAQPSDDMDRHQQALWSLSSAAGSLWFRGKTVGRTNLLWLAYSEPCS